MYAIDDTTSEPVTADSLAEEFRTVVALRTKGRCRDGHGTLTHLFFSDDLYDVARAKAICAKCQVADLCLDTALARQEPWGVWGGQLIATRTHRPSQATTRSTTEVPAARAGRGRGPASSLLGHRRVRTAATGSGRTATPRAAA